MENNVCGTCFVCGHDLVWDKDADNCYLTEGLGVEDGETGGVDVKEILCKECGTLHRVWVGRDNEEDDEYVGGVGNQGFGNCFNCGGTIIWSGDFMRSETEGGDLSDADDSIVHECVCADCGNAITIIEPSENEMRSGKYPHWKGYENI